MSAEGRQSDIWHRMAQALAWVARIPAKVIRGFGRGLRRIVGSVRFWVFAIVCLLVLLVAYYALAEIHTPFTTEAYAQAYVVQVAPQVAERVVRVHVSEGSRVKAGDLLFELDPRYSNKVSHRSRRSWSRRSIRSSNSMPSWQPRRPITSVSSPMPITPPQFTGKRRQSIRPSRRPSAAISRPFRRKNRARPPSASRKTTSAVLKMPSVLASLERMPWWRR